MLRVLPADCLLPTTALPTLVDEYDTGNFVKGKGKLSQPETVDMELSSSVDKFIQDAICSDFLKSDRLSVSTLTSECHIREYEMENRKESIVRQFSVCQHHAEDSDEGLKQCNDGSVLRA